MFEATDDGEKKNGETKGFVRARLRLSLSVCLCMCYKLFRVSLKCVEDSVFVSPTRWYRTVVVEEVL